MTALWIAFLLGQVLNAGNINYQQEQGYHEVNPIYGSHPSSSKVYAIKAAECLAVYGLTELFPKHDKKIMVGANVIVWGTLVVDKEYFGIKMKFRF